MYTFAHGFMRDMARSRMLRAQRKKLAVRIQEIKSQNLNHIQWTAAPSREGEMNMLRLNETLQVLFLFYFILI
jgi:hypothetical protein